MDDKQEFKIEPLEEEQERVVQTSIEEIPADDKTSFECQEIVDNIPLDIEEAKRISLGNIKANLTPKKPVKELTYGSIFVTLAIASLIVGFLIEGYKTVGIICFVLAGFAGYAMFNTVIQAKKIQRLLDEGKCSTIAELMTELKLKKKYEFLRDLGGMIRAGYVVGYEVINDNEIRKVN